MPANVGWTPEDLRTAEAHMFYDECPAAYRAVRTYAAHRQKRAERGYGGSAQTRRPHLAPPLEPTVREEDLPDTLAGWEERWGHLKAADTLLAQVAPTTEVTEWTSPDCLPVGIVFTGDWHCGAGGVRYDLLERDIALIRDTPGLYPIVQGDVLENVKPQSKAGNALYGGLFNHPKEQGLYAKTRLLMLGEILAICRGNHDGFDDRWAGVDRLEDIANAAGAPYFTEGGGTVFVNVGTQRYVLVVRHNHVGNSRLNSTNAQRRMFDDFKQWESADAICISHLHFNDCHKTQRRGGRTVYLRSGTYKTRDAYAQAGSFTPEYGNPLVILFPDDKRVLPFSGEDWLYGVEYLGVLRERYAQEATWQGIA